jgi:hypothetical protein
VTLIELLVVLTLMATLLGLGVSMYLNLGKQGVFTASAARILSTINRVRNSSMTHPAALQIHSGDPDKGQENSIRGVEYVPMWASQFEPPPEGEPIQGALDRNAPVPSGAVFKDGVVGKALFLEGGGVVDCGNHPAYDATEGVSVDLWVYPTLNASGTLVYRGEALVLSLSRGMDGPGIRFELTFAVGPAGEPGKGDSAIAESRKFEIPDAALPLNRWSRIIASYDRNFVLVAVDTGRGPVERYRERETHPLAPARKANLFLCGGGGSGGAFRGGIDGVRIDGVLGEAYEPLPPTVRVSSPRTRIWFRDGRLDPAYHTLPETIILTYGKRTKTIVLGLEGNVSSK